MGLPEKRQAIKLALEPSPYPGDISPEGRVSRRFIGWGRGSLNLLLFLLYLSLLCIHLHGAGTEPTCSTQKHRLTACSNIITNNSTNIQRHSSSSHLHFVPPQPLPLQQSAQVSEGDPLGTQDGVGGVVRLVEQEGG